MSEIENIENSDTVPLNLELDIGQVLLDLEFVELMDLELVELVELVEPVEPVEPVVAGMFVDGRTAHPMPVVPVISSTLFSDWDGEEPEEPEEPGEADWILPISPLAAPAAPEYTGYPDPDLNTLAFYPRHVPHMFVNVSRSHWDEMKVGDHVCSICFEKFDETVTELNCTHGAAGKHFFCQGCANTWWQTCLAGNHVPSCACCRTATASAVTWVKPRKRNGSELESSLESESKRPRVVV